MKIVPIITAVLVCAAIYILILERDLLSGGPEMKLSAQEQALADAQQAQTDAQTKFDQAKAELASAEGEIAAAQEKLSPEAEVVEKTSSAVSVVAIKSKAQQIRSGIVLRGETAAGKFVEVKAETSGQVISQPLRKGTLVEEGELLCELDPGTRAATLTEARARVAEAEANNKASSQLVKKGFASETQAIARQASLESAQASLLRAEEDLANLKVLAPFSGLLETDSAELGALMQPGTPCATVIALDPIKLVGFATEQQVARIEVGAIAGARLISGEEISGTVSFISRSADQTTRTFRVEVTVPNPLLEIRDGSTADILIALAGVKGHLLPQSALTLNNEGQLGVRIAENETAGFAPVTVIRDTQEGIWLAGLPDQVDVIILGQEYVVTGSEISITYKDDAS